MIRKDPVASDSIKDEWVAVVRELVDRQGRALRGLPGRRYIEVKSLTTNEWQPLGLPDGGFEFTSEAERDLFLARLTVINLSFPDIR